MNILANFYLCAEPLSISWETTGALAIFFLQSQRLQNRTVWARSNRNSTLSFDFVAGIPVDDFLPDE
jgi:hypothetical protein